VTARGGSSGESCHCSLTIAPGGAGTGPSSSGSSVSRIQLSSRAIEESRWDAFFEHSGIKPVLVLYENFAADYETSTLRLGTDFDLVPAKP
jgi:LPS sulfotransferase NodH